MRLLGRRSQFGLNVPYGLLFFIIAAYVYPNREALAEDISSLGPRIRVAELVEFARNACETLRGTVQTEDAIRNQVETLLAADRRIAQEATGWELLQKVASLI